MARFGSDIKRRRLNMTLFRKCPLIVLFREFGHWVGVFRSGKHGLECFWAVDGFGGAGDTGDSEPLELYASATYAPWAHFHMIFVRGYVLVC